MTDLFRDQLQTSLGAAYTLERELGGGGMARVFLAEETRLGRRVVVKVLSPDLAAGVSIERFEREILVAAMLQNPRIVPVLAAGDAGGLPYYTMPFVDGETLRARLERGRVSPRDAVIILRDVALALECAHAQGVVHRDVKPENVLLSGGTAVVTDFGIAKALSAARADATLTQLGIALGTPAYMAPEQAAGDGVDHRADLYAWGLIAYELLAGRHPFAHKTSAQQLIAAHVIEAPAPLDDAHPGLPPVLTALVDRCLAKEPADRPARTSELLPALEAAGVAITAPRHAAVPRVRDERPSVAVLPFGNIGPDSSDDYLATGLTEEVIADLAGVRALRVISRNSAMRFRNADEDPRAAARELDVRHVLTGTVRRAGNGLRVTAQLVDVELDTHIWAEKFTGTLDDVFAIQEEISRRIVEALAVQLTAAEERHVAARPIEDVAAYQCYLRAREDMYRWTADGLANARREVDDALSIIGENALLLATRGFICWMGPNTGLDVRDDLLGEATTYAERALALDPQSSLAILVRGLVAGTRGDLAAALPDLWRAHALAPGDANVLVELYRCLISAGQEQSDAARALVDELVRVDPLTPITWMQVAACELHGGRYVEALPGARRALARLHPSSPLRLTMATVLAGAGEREEAVDALLPMETSPANTLASVGLFWGYALRGDAARALAYASPELERAARYNEYILRYLAEAYALAGRPDDALRCLRAAVDRGFVNYPFLAHHDRFLDSLRGMTPFEALLLDVQRRWQALSA